MLNFAWMVLFHFCLAIRSSFLRELNRNDDALRLIFAFQLRMQQLDGHPAYF
ncbi:MAG: hypothetical protein K0Q59_5504, partial [Paenibacillus sp.]|nr:hypothetical protein [Paenibacillus sp.]